MGVVYEAEQVSLGRRVALKVLPGHVVGRPQGAGAVPPRGAGGGAAAPHQHRAGLRGRPGRRRRLLRDAVHPGPGARPGHRRAAAAPRARSEGDRARPARPGDREAAATVDRPRADAASIPRNAHARPDGRIAPDRPAGDRGAGVDPRAAPTAATGLAADRAIRPRRDLGPRGRRRRDATRRRPRRPPSASASAVLPGGTARLGRSTPRAVASRSSGAWPRSAARRRRGWPTPTPAGSSTATSSRRTCCSTPTGVVWITDFGLAKADDDGLTARPATSSARSATWPPSGSAARGTPAPTSTPWA